MRNMPSLASVRRVLCAVALLWLLPAVFSPDAHARSGSGLYLSGAAGMALSSTSDFNSAVTKGQTDFDSGLGYSVALGFGWSALRMEAEASWRRTDLDSIQYDQLTVDGHKLPANVIQAINNNVDVNGTRTTLGLMANAWYDVDIGMPFTPYFGGGLGVTRVVYDVGLPVELPGSVTLPSGTVATVLGGLGGDDADWVLAYQVGAGVGYRLLESLVVHAGYRYVGTGDPKADWIHGSTVKSEVGNHVFRVGVRIGF